MGPGPGGVHNGPKDPLLHCRSSESMWSQAKKQFREIVHWLFGAESRWT